ncbi:flagellar biosynthesis protein FlgJ [Methylosinus sporium]|uniref:Flagellar biosynthesis protein FlgJ n=2 Tax=Methylosinus TaxID=425 RepID=A0A549T2F3_METSR|nr:rod-binding protein [Methylosinus sporium]MBU3890003.1 rod-binding protein [Methylosinus sp. KRF6]TRL36047.1 flagellar biosynthesis protein FlgJ [Methylosinus sporium]
MSIFPATDLVTEVAKAAEPARRNAAVARLSEISNATPNSVDGFATLVADRRDASSTATPTITARPVMIDAAATASRDIRSADATQKFEAFIIQSSLEAILPKSEGGFFGRGTAGDVWRSMIAEQIGDQIAKAGGLGLRKLLDHDLALRAERTKT